MIKNENFVQIGAWMINQLHLKGNELLIYALIYGFSKDGNSVFRGSINYIASWFGISERSTIENLKSLIEKKLITKNVIKSNGNIIGCEYAVTPISISNEIKSYLHNQDYILIMGWMINQLHLKGNELLVYALIYGFCQNTQSKFKGSLKYITNWLCITEPGVIKVLKSLINQNQIEKTVKSGPGAIKYCEYNTKQNAEGTTKLFAQATKQSAEGTTKLFAQATKQSAEGTTKLFAQATKQSAEGTTKLFADNITNNNARENSTSTDSTIIKTNSEEEVFLIINNKINELFENQIEFSPDTASKLLESFKKSKLDIQKISNYVQWAYDYLKERCKKEECFPGYFYNSISKTSLIFKFKTKISIEQENAKQKQIQLIDCLICGNKHNIHEQCEQCGYDYSQLKNKKQNEINKIKRIYFLDPETKLKFNTEYQKIFQKYPSLSIISNPNIKKEFETEIFNLEIKYGLNEECV